MSDEAIAGRYRLLEPLGRGAMSAVWLAEDEELARRVAVKTLAPSADRARFEREARAVAALQHPHICALYDYGEADGRPYMVLEYLPNGSLEERLRSGPLRDAETARVAAEVAAGLAHAHGRELVHRDLKPANILFDAEERAKIADFGIARMGGTGTLTEAGTVLGTAAYISPEQAAGRPAGPPSDVYSFGVILFRMLTGQLPFSSQNAMELVRMHRDDPPPRVLDVRPDAPRHLAGVADAALAKDPAARPADGAALLARLRGGADTAATMVVARAGEATQALPPSRPRRSLLPFALGGGALLLLAGGALALALGGSGGDGASSTTTTSLSLPNVATGRTEGTTTAPLTTTAPASTPATTAARTTTAATTTTAPQPTTLPVTTAPVTSTPAPPPTTVPTTTAPPPTTAPTTTTDTVPTTTGAGTTTSP